MIHTLCDLSAYQGVPDFAAMKAAGFSGALCKATEGSQYVSQDFAPQWAGLQARSMVAASYTFSRWNSGTPEAEADALLAALGTRQGPIALDMEGLPQPNGTLVFPTEDMSWWVLRFNARIHAAKRRNVTVYADYDFIRQFLQSPTLATLPLWLAWYPPNPTTDGSMWPTAPGPWKAVDVWQYSGNGRIPGVVGPVDTDLYRGSAAELMALGKPPVPPFKADWLLVTAQDRRVAPRVQEPKLPLIPANTTLEQLPYPKTSVAYNKAHWIFAKTEAGLTSWIDKANAKPLKP